jgi:BirA family biotin operon repressor/biotin-[acetyl-CoA-carboxylase] ligase
MKEQILRLLRESGSYVSGQRLCEELGVSRTAIWKKIKALQEEGYQITAVTNKGYLLEAEPDLMNEDAVGSLLHTKQLGRTMAYFDEIDSTNNYCKRMAEEGAPHGLLAVADRQVSGRGRRGRVWETPSGTSVAMSMLLRPQLQPDRASMLTIVAAMAVAEAVKSVSALPVKIKWPNDIVINGKKLCGILTEMSVELSAINYVVVGIGINVNNSSFPEEIAHTATSMYLEQKSHVSRSRVIAAVTDAFERYYEIFMETQDLSGLKEDYEKNLVNLGAGVRVVTGEGVVEDEGTALGIDAFGRLMVQLDDGSVKNVMAGEVSVRGMDGYV